ncbi:plastocyanin/azurin family copper-binding protein [Paenibacillus aestuarii]|uniref:Plastocyanin/azurin family copper-binding protein n=1 Tax=Paenibacillus aestuarii TaxID=516965 RepID=A0ABW0K2E4_9BACL|nr:plastocyanin/azurin family copper-binding protein [Paenibacillus aestuarii]
MRKKVLAFLLSSALMLPYAGMALAADAVAAAPQSWNVSVGKEQDQTSLDSMFPKVIYIHAGDTVKFTDGAMFTPHTVTFLAGNTPIGPDDPKAGAPSAPSGSKWDGKSLMNSGILMPGQDYSITFTAVGAYNYACILHPLMTGTVVVLPAGAPIPSVIEQAAGVKADTDDLLAQVDALKHMSTDLNYMKNADGSTMYMIDAGMGHRGFTLNAMMPETLYINEGDSVEWLNNNMYEPHFVTFNKPDNMSFFTPEGAMNPAFMAPAGGDHFDGTGFTNSGIIMAQKTYSLTFTTAGTYTYECYMHSGSKMTGTIVVAPKGAVKLTVNGKPATTAEALLVRGHVYAGIVPMVEALGGTVEWNNELHAVVVNVGGKHDLPAQLAPTSGVALVINGKQFFSDLAPQIIDGHSYAAVEDMVNLLGGTYSWNEALQLCAVTLNP